MRPADRLSATVPFETALAESRRLVVKQQRNVLENFTGIEARGRYAVHTEQGAFTAGFSEHAEGAGSLAARWFLKANRPFTMSLYPAEHPDRPTLVLVRPWRWFFAHMEVREAAGGRVLGRIQQRWGWFRKRLDVEAPGGAVLARLTGPFFRPWTLLLETGPAGGGREGGRIEKKWSGLLRETFTDADNFLVTLPPGDATLRRLVLAAAVLVDFLWFEHRD